MTAGFRFGLILLLLCRCSVEPQTLTLDGGGATDLGTPDIAGCDTFACLGVLAYGDKAQFNVATPCVKYKTNLQPSLVCEGCACLAAQIDCVITASTWGDARCITAFVDRKSAGGKDMTLISTFLGSGFAKVESATTKCAVDTAVKGGPAYASDDSYICNYFGSCSDLSCAAASEAHCLLLSDNVECPAPFPQKEVAFTSVDDKRTCTCDCAGAQGSCIVPPGVQVAALSAPGIHDLLTSACKPNSSTMAVPPNNVVLSSLGALVPSCISAGKPVTGTIEVRGYKTVCCR